MKPSIGVLLVIALAGPVHGAVKNGAVPKSMMEAVRPFLGDYRGNWNTEMSESDVDDISRYDLSDSVMRLSLDENRRLAIAFYLDPGAAAQNQPLDLLGYGCKSSTGPLLDIDQGTAADGTPVIHLVFDFDWGRCPSRVHAVKSTKLHMELIEDAAEDSYAARLTILRKVQGDYQVYAKVDGKSVPVEVRPSSKGDGTLYNPGLEYCTEDELGEKTCFSESERTTVGALPGPVMPGATVFWWTHKTPRLKVEKGKQLRHHEAVYVRPRA